MLNIYSIPDELVITANRAAITTDVVHVHQGDDVALACSTNGGGQS